MVRRATPPRLPKGYEPSHTSYKVITETYYEKPYKAPKVTKGRDRPAKEYVQKVQVVNPKVLSKGKGKRGR